MLPVGVALWPPPPALGPLLALVLPYQVCGCWVWVGGWWLWVGVVVGVEFAEGGVGEFGEFGWGLVFGSFEGLGGGGVVSFVVE
jgi:hypothetical protein